MRRARLEATWLWLFSLLLVLLPTSLAEEKQCGIPPFQQKWAAIPVSESTGTRTFITEPFLEQLAFDIRRMPSNRSLLSDGYLFLTSFGLYEKTSAALIYDYDGNIVWAHHIGKATQNLQPCDYLGQRGKHICLFNRELPSYSEIYDQNYRMVARFSTTEAHEFNPLPSGWTAISTEQYRKDYDTSAYTGQEGGRVRDVCMSEVDMRSMNKIFEWCYLDYLPIWATKVYMPIEGPIGEVNKSRSSPSAVEHPLSNPPIWDFAHINSADKFDGDYIMSFRHLDQLIKIAGPENRHDVKPGTVLWRLGGIGSDFELLNFNFSKQHHVRVHSVTSTETVISLFDNASEGHLPATSSTSSGMVIRANNRTMKAEMIRQYPHPDGHRATRLGSFQLLPNDNALLYFGDLPDIVEYDRNGKLLYHASFSRFKSGHGDIEWADETLSYRVLSSPWVGKPLMPPKLVVYSKTCSHDTSSPLIAYVSWNGATEVKSWRFRVSTGSSGPWVLAGTYKKTGFETQVSILAFHHRFVAFPQYVAVDGLNADGNVLGGTRTKVFVPQRASEWRCDDFACNSPLPFPYAEGDSLTCPIGASRAAICSLALLLCLLEAVSLLLSRVGDFSLEIFAK